MRSVHRIAFTLDRCRLDRELLATRGDRLALTRTTVTFEDGDAGPAEVTCLQVLQVDEHGRFTTMLAFDVDDLSSACNELDARHAALTVANLAWRAAERQATSVNTDDWESFAATFTPEAEADDRRSGIALILRGEEVRATHHVLFTLDQKRLMHELVATRGDRLALAHATVTFEDGDAGPAEVTYLNVFQVEPHGRVTHMISFNADDLAGAHDELNARAAALDGEAEPAANLAWRAAQAQTKMVHTGDWETFTASVAPGFEDNDRRTGIGLVTRGEHALSVYRVMFELDRCRQARELLATRGERLALMRSTVTFQDGVAGPAEIVSLNLFEVDERGLLTRLTKFDIDDLAGAYYELDARAAALEFEGDPLAIPRNRAVRTVQQDGWTLISALDDNLCLHATTDGFVVHEVDASGKVAAQIDYTADNRRAAANEIARRFHEQHNVPVLASAMTTSLNAHDLAGARDALADSCIVEDHRQLRVVAFHSADEWLEIMASTLAMVPDYLCEILRCFAAEPWGHSVLTRISGTTTEGSPFESLHVTLSRWDSHGRAAILGIFDPEDPSDAVARLRELAP